jgi:hypothetical protein
MRHTGKKQLFLQILLCSSVLLSFSRSGIATCILLMAVRALPSLLQRRSVRAGPLLVLISAAAVACFYSDTSLYFFKRLFYFFEDDSAYLRWNTFQHGWSHFVQYPLLGMGYNFLANPVHNQGIILTVDSSLLHTLIDFGLIPCLFLLIGGVVWSLNRFALYKETPLYAIFKEFFIYTLIIAIFSSLFYNILYYQFWLIPIVAIFVYLSENYQNVFANCIST